MNANNAMRVFNSALSIMAAAEKVTARANTLTWKNSAFVSFEQLLNAGGDYRPSFSRATPDCRELAALYDAAQQARGDSRRAYMYGKPARKGSILDRDNWDSSEQWYRQGQRIAWWDRYTRQWIAYTVCGKGYQEGAADFYPNMAALLTGEHAHA